MSEGLFEEVTEQRPGYSERTEHSPKYRRGRAFTPKGMVYVQTETRACLDVSRIVRRSVWLKGNEQGVRVKGKPKARSHQTL